MGRYYSYINTTLKILQSYNGEMPFAFFIKQFFAKEKKYGSKDRKQIAALCYSWFRVGLALKKNITEENIIKAFFLSTNEPSVLIQELKPAWNNAISDTIEDKIKIAGFSVADIFPFKDALNDVTHFNTFCKSFLIQPEVFVRIRPQNKRSILDKIKTADFHGSILNNGNTIQFASGINIESILAVDKDVVIQDYNSQQVLNYLSTNNFSHKKEITAWDCCAASGGKSILLYDILDGEVKLTVSDIRQTIIANLMQRFKNAGIKNYQQFIADISSEKKIPASSYDIIICDAPCTGSGTWSRTPEQLYFFDPASIEKFSTLQKKIADNVIQHLKADGLFFYITCSVFKGENEEVVEHISKQPGMLLIEMKNLFGYEIKADSMFVAVFKKVSC